MSDVTSYEVTGDWRHIVDDGMVDGDDLPDEVPLKGKVVFKPVYPSVATAGVPVTAYTLGPVTALVAGGVLTDLQGRPGVKLAGQVGAHTVRWTAETTLRFQEQKVDYPRVTFELAEDVRLTGIITQSGASLSPIVVDPRIEALAESVENINLAVVEAEGYASDAAGQVVLAGQEADRAIGLAGAQDEHIAGTLENPTSATHAAFKAVGNATYRPIFGVSIDYVNDASLDATAHVQARMDAAAAAGGGEVYVTGVLRIDGTLIVPGKVTLYLAQGAQLVRYAAHSTSTAPVVVVGRGYGRLVGESPKGSLVLSENPTPEGVVVLGHSDYISVVSVQHAAVESVGVRGHAQGGNTTGSPTVALALTSRQENGTPNAATVVYFNSVKDVACENANIGVLMEGWVNANYVNDIFLNQVGNAEQLGGAGIVIKAFNASRPMDLMIGRVFHHGSSGAATLRIETNITHSEIGPIVSEPGGNSRFVRLVGTAEQSASVRLHGVSNNAGGFGFTDAFRANNVLSVNGEESVHKLDVIDAVTVGGLMSAVTAIATNGRLSDTAYSAATTSQVPENSERAIAAVTIGQATHYHCLIEMDVEITFGVTQTRHARAEFLARSTPTGVTVTALPSPATAAFIVEPVVAGQVVTLGVKTPNSGTGATATVTARVRAHSYRASVVMLNPATTTIASTTVLPAGVGGLGAVTSGAPSSAMKKVQLFDAAGVSLGFIAVSDS